MYLLLVQVVGGTGIHMKCSTLRHLKLTLMDSWPLNNAGTPTSRVQRRSKIHV